MYLSQNDSLSLSPSLQLKKEKQWKKYSPRVRINNKKEWVVTGG